MASKDTVDSRTVKISEARTLIRKAISKRRPVFIWGPPGVGKSDLVGQIADDLNGITIDMRMALMEPTDIKGIPYYNATENTMKWAPPSDLPTVEFASQYDIVILFLDELNSAPPAVQAAAYQLVLNRRVGQYVLPDNVVVVAAGNRLSDKGVAYRMPSPLANRFVHVELHVDFPDWQVWAVKNQIHPDVVGYLSYQKADLFQFDPQVHDRSFGTPRSWSFVSDLLDDQMTDNQQSDLVAGCVGSGLSVKFMAHRKVAARLPNPTDVLAGKVTTMDVKEISAKFSLVTAMCYELKAAYDSLNKEKKLDAWHPMCEHFIQFMMDNMEKEIVVMGAATALKTYELKFDYRKLKNFKEFYDKFAHLIVDVDAK
jgi:hypothetical protein